jgi:hypothetical protein
MKQKELRRGIDPKILLSHVENTMPYLFHTQSPLTPYTQIVLQARSKEHFTHDEYFALCLAAHASTVATFVPTDVDNQIRKHLWHAPLQYTEKMARLTLESLSWDYRPVTTRYQEANHYYVSGHQGEWFSVAVGVYAAHRKSQPSLAEQIKEAILREVRQEAEIFSNFKKQKKLIGVSKFETNRQSTRIAFAN